MNIFLNRLLKCFFFYILIGQLNHSVKLLVQFRMKISEYAENSYDYGSSVFSSKSENEESEEILSSEGKAEKADESIKEIEKRFSARRNS